MNLDESTAVILVMLSWGGPLRAMVDILSDPPAKFCPTRLLTCSERNTRRRARDGSTLPIEVNGGCALDPRGLQHGLYAKLLSARWAELAGVPGECAF